MEKYNVLYIHTHDSGQIFSPYHYQVPTDNLLDFSKDATVFNNAFCASPTCSPSRAALVTGKYPHHNGMIGLGNRGFCLNDYNEHMVNIFNENGYTTVLCGIQHEYGRYSDHQNGAEKIGYQHDISSDCTGFSEKEMVEWDAANTEQFVNWLSGYPDEKPFFASFGFFSTHREYPDCSENSRKPEVQIPGFLRDYKEVREDFEGHTESLRLFDSNFGKIIQALKDSGAYDKTIIFFTTDHGIPFPRAKCTLYDAGIQVALIMRVPSKEQGNMVDALISQVDILPTLCSLLHLTPQASFDGRDFSILFDKPNEKIREEIFAEVNFHTSYEPIRCIRTTDYKYIRYYDNSFLKQNLSNIDSSMTKQLYLEKGFLKSQKDAEQFYDLKSDRFETHNLISSEAYQPIIKQLKKQLEMIQADTEDPVSSGNLKILDSWIVNTNECIDPKSKKAKDFRKKSESIG